MIELYPGQRYFWEHNPNIRAAEEGFMAKANNPEASLKKDMKHLDPASEGTRGGKSNDPTATLRSGSLPKGESVREVKPESGVAVRCAQKQNTSDGGTDPKKRNVIPNKSDESLIVTAVAKVKE